MKKPSHSILLMLTAVFAAFTLGVFIGRNHTASAITLSIPTAMHSAPEASVVTESTAADDIPSVSFPININQATKEELMALPGIGDVLAQRIIAYRDSKGDFSAPEGLMYVEGIGEKRVEDIIDLITIGG
ncbi:MAG: helix-hairpin-helix domain-containing protein [Oscillospiraceae bacterium]|nr:helix-hairpin-helix domain-containing protein [Oscillospiraceae bacterium]